MLGLDNCTEIIVEPINPELENKLNFQRKVVRMNTNYKKRLMRPLHQNQNFKSEFDLDDSNKIIEAESINPDSTYFSMVNKLDEYQNISNYHDKKFGLKMLKKKSNNITEAEDDLKSETVRIIERINKKKKIDPTTSLIKTLPQFFKSHSIEKYMPCETDLRHEIKEDTQNKLVANLRSISSLANSKVKKRMHQELLSIKRNLKFETKTEITTTMVKPILTLDGEISSPEKRKNAQISPNAKIPKNFQNFIPKSMSKTLNTAKESVKKMLQITKSLTKGPANTFFSQSTTKDYHDSYDEKNFSPVRSKNRSTADETALDIPIFSGLSGIRKHKSAIVQNDRPTFSERNSHNLEPSQSQIGTTSRKSKFLDKKIEFKSYRSEEKNLILKPQSEFQISNQILFNDFLMKLSQPKKKYSKNSIESIESNDLKQAIRNSFNDNYRMERINTNIIDHDSNRDTLSESRETTGNFIAEK